MTNTGEARLSVRRWYDVSPDVVFEAFIEAQWLERWFCPSPDVTVSVTELEPHVGGRYRFLFRFPGDRVAVVVGEYRAVDRPHRLAFTWTWEPPDPHAGVETLVTVEFIDKGGGTELSLRHKRFPGDGLMRQHESGWHATLDRLAPVLRGFARG